jgi:hypothetical protein
MFEAASSDYAIGLKNFNIDCNQSPMKQILTAYTGTYEQYRIRQVNIRAQVGKGYTNDLRIKTYLGARVDVDHQLTGVTVDNVQAINASENSVIKTFTERGNVMLASYRPQCRTTTNVSLPLLPNRLQFFPIADHSSHIWKGATLTAMVPEPHLAVNSVGITLIAEVDVEFRGRITNNIVFSNSTINQNDGVVPPTYDLTEPQMDLKNNLLTGTYFPLSAWPINIGNIGTSVTAAEIIGLTFRIQATMVKYEIVMYANGDYGANIFV